MGVRLAGGWKPGGYYQGIHAARLWSGAPALMLSAKTRHHRGGQFCLVGIGWASSGLMGVDCYPSGWAGMPQGFNT